MKIFVAALALLALPLSAPAMAYGPDWSQPGDYYAPDNTAVQPLTPQEQGLVQDGDYYAPRNTSVQQPTPEQLKLDREGDYYAPAKIKQTSNIRWSTFHPPPKTLRNKEAAERATCHPIGQ